MTWAQSNDRKQKHKLIEMECLGNEEKRRRIREGEDESPIHNKEADEQYHNDADNEEEGNEKENEKEEGDPFSTISARRAVVLPTKGELEATCAKWCRMLDDGSCQWDRTKIKCFLSEDELNDPLLLRNLIHGTILGSKVHPLIFEAGMEDDDEVRLRSLPFFNRLLADGEKGISTYRALSSDQKRIVAVGVRDLYLAACQGLLSNQEKRLLDGMVQMLDETVGCVQAIGMNICFHPSANFKVVKLIEALDDAVDDWAPFFAQQVTEPKLFVVFVDPAELSFHNFENIIPLDSWFERKLENDDGLGGLLLSLSNLCQVQSNREVFTCKLEGAACGIMNELSSLDLYVEPMNKAARGGERFIFHSALLCKALSKAVASSNLLNKLAWGRLGHSFEFVNYVFRANRFKSRDAIFEAHRDTPYYDSARSHVSKYTLLIYLTGGHNRPALRIEDVDLNEIGEMTCVIFDQSYEHEGSPFIEGNKRFIRSELIFTDRQLDHNSQIASLFSEACYMTGQSVLDEGLTSYAHECFERANSLHWAIEKEATQPPVYLQKQFHGISFMTNGYNYWFAKDCGVNAVDCGMVAVLDYFNCKIGGQPFRSLCNTKTIRERFDKTEDVWTSLQDIRSENTKPFERITEADVESLIDNPLGPRSRFEWQIAREGHLSEGVTCCPAHRGSRFKVWNSPDMLTAYKICCDFTRKKLLRAPLMVFGQEIVINDSNIKIIGDKMFFLKGPNSKPFKPLPRINFAACWQGDAQAENFIDIDYEIPTPQFLIPPIMFSELDHGYHMVLDFFRNDWMVQVDDEITAPVPTVLEKAVPDELPLYRKIDPSRCYYPCQPAEEVEDISYNLHPGNYEQFKIFADDENFRTKLFYRYRPFSISEDEREDSENEREDSEDEREDSDSLRAGWDELFKW